MKSFNDGCAANDEFQTANSGLQRGELVRDLLRQRLQLPVVPTHSLARPHLDALVAEALTPRGVTFVEAPCGYGKSHTVAMGVQAAGIKDEGVRWFPLNSQDNAPTRFLSLLSVALDIPESSESSLQGGATFSDALAIMLLGLKKTPAEEHSVLILDGLHHITNPAVIALIQQLVADIPPYFSVVMVSRQALPYETHALELENRFTRIGVEKLEFSRSETFEFFRDVLSDQQLTSVAIDHLYDLTEGWPTPLALYRRDILQSTERHTVSETPGVERFLKESVLGNVSPSQVRALRAISELGPCSDELVLALQSLIPDGVMLPSDAYERGLPLKVMPGWGRWYRLNPLLVEWLKAPVMAGYADRMLAASQWFGSRDQFPEALKYSLLAGDAEEVIRIASEGSEALLLGQDTASLLRLRKSLPAPLLERSSRLRIVYSWVHAIGGQFRQARALIDGMDDASLQEHEARIWALRAFILRGEGQVAPALEMAERALSGLELSTQGQLVTEMVRASALCASGRFTEAREANRAASRLAREAGDSGSEALAVYSHARIELGKGALRHAEQLLRTGLDTVVQELARPARIGETRLQLNLVLVLWHQGRDAEADRLLVTCGRHAEQTRDLGLLLAMAIRVLMCRSQGRLEDAFVWIGRAERTMHTWQVDESLYVPVLEALKASCWLALGQLESVAQALRRLQPYREAGCVPELFPMMPGLLDCLQVRLDLARGETVRAREALASSRKRYNEAIPWGVDIHMRLLEAILVSEDKGLAAAQKMVLAVVSEAEKEHFISPFAELKLELRDLMEKAYNQLPVTAFRAALGHLFGIAEGKLPASLAEPISDREQSVLELIAQGLSNQEIADKLHISLHTVKTHARRINAKLEVRSRTQATVRARELGLL
ncbi:LuxR C-terminal-related transcriptional regulator [Marinobacter sp. 2_MG-2023]|uniref:LuxR C-terminal-related transcriptional regulator n=1 Tax=Marinobacter sp. 2_MG-2023 TaxID=3062679 RepID=UPI0026E3DFEA|nr:LuxR C-terminal-related transcriptional regulator [Marinobacter sp. 2_MG-2023]MDO6443738.1 LuxR C-terminal-related transcriptional regulator [Marinobacter sp. 2_MG-2023]